MKTFGKPRQPTDKYISWSCPKCEHRWAVDRVCVLGQAPWGKHPRSRVKYTRKGVRITESRMPGHCFCGEPFLGAL